MAKKKNKPSKNESIDKLNDILFKIAMLKGYRTEPVGALLPDAVKERYAARVCKDLGISSNGGKYTSKQISGLIGMAKGELRKLRRA